jgi:hypothetical protein
MQFARPMTVLLAFALLALAMGTIASAEETAEAAPAASEEDAKLQARAQAYWEARIKRSPEVMSFYAPEDKLPEGVRGTHAEGASVAWTEFEIEAVQADGDEGLVQVRAGMKLASDFDVRIPEAMRHLLKPTMMERWIRVEGEWYKRPIQPGLSRMMGRRQSAERAEASAKEAPEATPATD